MPTGLWEGGSLAGVRQRRRTGRGRWRSSPNGGAGGRRPAGGSEKADARPGLVMPATVQLPRMVNGAAAGAADELAAAIYRMLDRTPRHLEELVDQSDVPVNQVLRALTRLEMAGWPRRRPADGTPPGSYRSSWSRPGRSGRRSPATVREPLIGGKFLWSCLLAIQRCTGDNRSGLSLGLSALGKDNRPEIIVFS